MNSHCEERGPSPVIARLTESIEAIARLSLSKSHGSGQAPQSDLKGHSERGKESQRDCAACPESPPSTNIPSRLTWPPRAGMLLLFQ